MTGMSRLVQTPAVLIAVTALALATLPAAAQDAGPDAAPVAFEVRMSPLPDGVRKVWIEPAGDGGQRYVLELESGEREHVTPAQLAARLRRGGFGEDLCDLAVAVTERIRHALEVDLEFHARDAVEGCEVLLGQWLGGPTAKTRPQ